MTYLIVCGLIAIVAALAGAGLFMLKGHSKNPEDKSARMAKALALRVGLSVALFLFILLAYQLGWIHPTGIPTQR